MAYTKKVVSGGAEKKNGKEFKIKKEKGTEEECLILFDTDVNYVVNKLSFEGLPDSLDNKPITWFVNFEVTDDKGNPINGVPYSLLFPPLPTNTVLVIFDGKTAFDFKGTIKDRTHGNKQWKEITLDIGDPGGGTHPGG
ncbi:MAG: hypothetical protein AB1649_09635 [Chloroflexota bacterium]